MAGVYNPGLNRGQGIDPSAIYDRLAGMDQVRQERADNIQPVEGFNHSPWAQVSAQQNMSQAANNEASPEQSAGRSPNGKKEKPPKPSEYDNAVNVDQVSYAASAPEYIGEKTSSVYEKIQKDSLTLNDDELEDFDGMAKDEKFGYMIGRQMRSINEYGKGISGLEDELNEIQSADTPVNYSALMALTDQWTGSNFAKLYKAPQTPEEKAQLVLKLRSSINNQKLNMANSQASLVKSLAANQAQGNAMKLAKLKQLAPTTFKANQYKAARFTMGAEDAHRDMTKVGDEVMLGLDAKMEQFGVSNMLDLFSMREKDPQIKAYENAAKSFVMNVLRPDTGAAIAEFELKASDFDYIAQPTDTPQILEAKRRRREKRIAGLKAESGGAYDQAKAIYESERSPDKSADQILVEQKVANKNGLKSRADFTYSIPSREEFDKQKASQGGA